MRLYLFGPEEDLRREYDERRLDGFVRAAWLAFFWVAGLVALGGLFGAFGLA